MDKCLSLSFLSICILPAVMLKCACWKASAAVAAGMHNCSECSPAITLGKDGAVNQRGLRYMF